MRLGLFGGTFDPVHYGHLLLAEMCREQCKLDAVWLIPAAQSPHKQPPVATAQQRVEMLRLALGGTPALDVSTLEIDRGGVSYTVDTLEALARSEPQHELYFLMGGDSLAELHTWRQPERICELATPVAVRRLGSPGPNYEVLSGLVDPERLETFRHWQVEMPLIELSSTEIRRRVANGFSIRFQTPRAVEAYIEANNLYR